MSEFSTLSQHAKEENEGQERKMRWRRIGRIYAIIFFLALGLDYGFFWRQSSATQRKLEEELRAYPLPADTVQIDFDSGHKTHQGWATRVLVSAKLPQEVCSFYLTQAAPQGWRVAHNDCEPPGDSSWLDTARGHYLLDLRRNNNSFRIRYFGFQSGKHLYRLTLNWGIFKE